jgi:translation initiation factor 2 beta subunit (eIF-2beta)/eIF-5
MIKNDKRHTMGNLIDSSRNTLVNKFTPEQVKAELRKHNEDWKKCLACEPRLP